MPQTKFIVNVTVNPGEQIRIVGNLPQIGQWNPSKALKCIQYDDDQWQSQQYIDTPSSIIVAQQRQEILVQDYQEIIWEDLPNNSNRRYKPEFHSRLLLYWSDPKGNVIRQKSSFKLSQKVPGIMFGSIELRQHVQNMHDAKQPKKQGKFRGFKKCFNPTKEAANDTDSDDDNNNSFGSLVLKKSTKDIRLSLTKQQFEHIYNTWTIKDSKVDKYYLNTQNDKKNQSLQICFLCTKQISDSQFICETLQQIQNFPSKQHINIRFIILGEILEQIQINQINPKKLQPLHQIPNNTQIIFLNLDALLKYLKLIQKKQNLLKHNFRFLYIQKSEFNHIRQSFEGKQRNYEIISNHIQLICFNDPQTNILLYDYFKYKHIFQQKHQNHQSENSFKLAKDIISNKIKKEIKFSLLDIIEEVQAIVSVEKWKNNSQNYQEVETHAFVQMPKNLMNITPDFYIIPDTLRQQHSNITKQYFTRNQIKQLTSTRNSILIVDMNLLEIDKQLLYNILPKQKQKMGRMAILIAQDFKQSEENRQHIQLLKRYKEREDVCIILKNYQKLILSDQLYQPLRRYYEIIKLIKCKIQFYSKQYNGKMFMHSHSIRYISNKANQAQNMIKNLRDQIQIYLQSSNIENNGVFSVTIKNNQLLFQWCFDKEIRLMKSLFKIKSIQDGDLNCEIYVISVQPYHQKLQAISKSLFQEGSKRICLLRYIKSLNQ